MDQNTTGLRRRDPDRRPPSTERDSVRLPDLRPASPGQLAVVGGLLCLAGLLAPALGILTLAGLAALLVAGLSFLIRPRTREMYWRGRRIDLGGEPWWGEHLYRLIYKR